MVATIEAAQLREWGELQDVEFKQSLSLQREGFENLCGMLNTDRGVGRVIFGVAPGGNPVGVEPGNLDTAQRTLAQHIRLKFDPPVVPDIEVLECQGKRLVSVKAGRAASVPYHEYDGRAWIKEGTTHRMLSVAEKQQLRVKRGRDHHQGPWKCDRCGSLAGIMFDAVVTDEGLRRSYACECGGEFWPTTWGS